MKMIKKPAIMLCMAVCLFLLFMPFSVGAFCFEEAGNMYGISPVLLKSVARAESGLDSSAVNMNKNGSADLGLMQINSNWIETFQIDRNELMSDPCYNVMIGARILRQCIDRHGYSWEAVGCYNACNKGKRVDYSWKIFREIEKEKARNKKIAKNKGTHRETENTGQSLYFRVHAKDSSDINGMP